MKYETRERESDREREREPSNNLEGYIERNADVVVVVAKREREIGESVVEKQENTSRNVKRKTKQKRNKKLTRKQKKQIENEKF